MDRTLDNALLAWLAGALDPGDTRELESLLAHRPDLRARLEHWKQVLGEAERRDRWRVPLPVPPPAPYAPGLLGLVTEAVLAGGPPRVGDRVVLRIAAPESPEAARPVVVREVAGTTEVVYPLSEEDWASLDAFRAEGTCRELDLVLGAPPGRHRYVVALVPTGEALDWTLPEPDRWRQVRERVEEGDLPAAAATVEVAAEG